MLKLNLGCGNNLLPGWVNIDSRKPKNIPEDVVFKRMRLECFRWHADSVDEMLLSHVLEHLKNPLDVLDRLYRTAKDGCRLEVRVPHGRADEAWEDQTHLRAYFPGSFTYFAQSTYTFGDYGYRANWVAEQMTLVAKPGSELETQLLTKTKKFDLALLDQANQVLEIRCILRARKGGEALQSFTLNYATLSKS